MRRDEEWFDSLEEALAHAGSQVAPVSPRPRPRAVYTNVLRTGAVALASWLVLQHLGALALGSGKRAHRSGAWSTLMEWT